MEYLKTPVDNLRIAAQMEREIHQAIKRNEDADDYLGIYKQVLDASIYLSAAEQADPNLSYGEDKDFISVKTVGALLCSHHAYIDAQYAQRKIWGGARQTSKDVVRLLESALQAAHKSAAYHPTQFSYLKAAEILSLLYRRDDAIQVLKNGIEKCKDNLDLKRAYDAFFYDSTKALKTSKLDRLKRPTFAFGWLFGALLGLSIGGPAGALVVLAGCALFLILVKDT